jgi:hypothetical protein
MEIRSESRLHHPVEAVFLAFRDHMPEVAAYIPDIKQVVVQSRKEEGDVVHLHNEWVAGAEVPAVAARFIKPEQLRWDDFAVWFASDRHCEWTIRTRVFTDAVRCSGQTRLIADGDATRVALIGALELDLSDIQGVPSFLGRRIAPQIEAFVVSLIKPNLERTNEAIGRFLDAGGV